MAQANETAGTPRIAVILAGGGGRRMGGIDKGEIALGGKRLIDRVVSRLAPQADRLLISGPNDYGLTLEMIPDRDDGPRGPAAGLWAAAQWITANFPAVGRFVAAPADGPFLPGDLIAELMEGDSSAVACNDEGDHPTFACWEISALLDALQSYPAGEGVSLRQLAQDCGAKRISFSPARLLMNVNTPEDLQRAEDILAEKQSE